VATRETFEEWLSRYQQAWRTDDPAQIGALFTDDAEYYPWPFSAPWRGREEIVSKWIERGDSTAEWRFTYSILAVEGDTGVLEGRTWYAARDGDPETEYANVWAVRFAQEDRAREFREWWVERPRAKASEAAA
jgi:hypothetical protein